MPPTIAPAESSDLGAIVTLLERNKLPVDGLTDHLTTTLVARAGETIVGCAAVEVYGAAGLLRSVAVDSARRGEGVGQRLSRAALDLARARGVKTIYLLTTTAGDFFPRFGFRNINRSEMDPALEHSAELRGACPASAVAMRADLNP